jgi:hypothetical protein
MLRPSARARACPRRPITRSAMPSSRGFQSRHTVSLPKNVPSTSQPTSVLPLPPPTHDQQKTTHLRTLSTRLNPARPTSAHLAAPHAGKCMAAHRLTLARSGRGRPPLRRPGEGPYSARPARDYELCSMAGRQVSHHLHDDRPSKSRLYEERAANFVA